MQRDDRDLVRVEKSTVRMAMTLSEPRGPSRSAAESGAEFIRNPEPRVPCLLLIDTSGSMSGEPIAELNDGLKLFQRTLAEDTLAAKRAETAIVSFGGAVYLAQDFATLHHLQIPQLAADGDTPMSDAILRGLEMVVERKRIYRENGITCYRPWIFLLTDGAPTDHALWQHAVKLVRNGEAKKEFEFFGIGVGEHADLVRLSELTTRPPARLRGLQFGEYFRWLSMSLTQCSRSRPGESINLPAPGWMTING